MPAAGDTVVAIHVSEMAVVSGVSGGLNVTDVGGRAKQHGSKKITPFSSISTHLRPSPPGVIREVGRVEIVLRIPQSGQHLHVRLHVRDHVDVTLLETCRIRTSSRILVRNDNTCAVDEGYVAEGCSTLKPHKSMEVTIVGRRRRTTPPTRCTSGEASAEGRGGRKRKIILSDLR